MLDATRDRVLGVWRRSLSLSWPLMVEEIFSTLMRTTDVFVTGLISPAAVAAVGLADLYAQLSLRFGLGLGGGAIALSSQDTGSEAVANRDEAITQAIVIGGIAGIPLAAFGLLFGDHAIAILGAEADVVRLGGLYLAVVLAAAPARIVGLIASRSLQGTGDTRTPMYVNMAANALNIGGSLGLGLGLGPVPRLGILGVGLSTATANVAAAIAFVALIVGPGSAVGVVRPRNPVITRQLLAVSIPESATGFVTTAVYFPFNALLVGFGTEVVAGYHIGRRMYTQTAGPLYRAYGTTASIIVGQTLGEGDPEGARFNAWALAGLALVTLGVAGGALVLAAVPLVRLFTRDPATVTFAAGFARTFGGIMLFVALFFVFSGAFRGAGDTRTPFVARLVGLVVFFLGASYLLGIVLEFGVPGVYIGVALSYVWMAIYLTVRFRRGDWAMRAADMMADRDSRPA